MTKNKNITSSSDEEFLDSYNYGNGSLESNQINLQTNSENEQEKLTPESQNDSNEDVVSLDNKSINIPLTLSINTISNTTSTKKYKVILSTSTKIIIDIDGNGASYSPSQFTKTLTFGDEVELPEEDTKVESE